MYSPSDPPSQAVARARWSVLRAACLPSQPWANGRGVTTEYLCEAPAAAGVGGPDWICRVSVATLDGPGPFSTFPGVDRIFVNAGPETVTLHVSSAHAAGRKVGLAPAEWTAFRGEDDVRAVVVSEPGHALNVMTRRGEGRADLTRLILAGGSTSVSVDPGARTMLVVLAGRCRAAGEDLDALDAITLPAADAAIDGASGRDAVDVADVIEVEAGEDPAELAVIALHRR